MAGAGCPFTHRRTANTSISLSLSRDPTIRGQRMRSTVAEGGASGSDAMVCRGGRARARRGRAGTVRLRRRRRRKRDARWWRDDGRILEADTEPLGMEWSSRAAAVDSCEFKTHCGKVGTLRDRAPEGWTKERWVHSAARLWLDLDPARRGASACMHVTSTFKSRKRERSLCGPQSQRTGRRASPSSRLEQSGCHVDQQENATPLHRLAKPAQPI